MKASPRRRGLTFASLPLVVVVMLAAVLGVGRIPLGASESRRSQQWSLDTLDLDELHGSVNGNGVVAAVLDTAIASGHQDLAGVLTEGFDFIEDRSFDPVAPDRQFAATDHGTMVASIIGAPADDVGITGVAPGVSIMPVRIIPDVGQGSAGDMAAGIRWALDHGADIINVSVRTSFDSTAVRSSVELAAEMGVPIVASGPTAYRMGRGTSFAILDRRPEPPALVAGTRFGNRLFLTWTPTSSDDVTGYQVLLDDYVVLSIEGGPSTALVPLSTPGTSNVVTVRAIDRTGHRSDPTRMVAPPAVRRAAIVGPAEAGSSDFFICTDCFPIEVARWRFR